MLEELDPTIGVEAESGSENIGQAVDEAVATEITPEPEYDFLEIDDDLASKYVRVKVDGEELPVSLNEALQGYSRTQDYTRKTQETAELRKQADQALRLQQAFATNPGMTVRILAENAGMPVEEFLGLSQAQQQQVLEDATEQYDDPLEKALAEERQARLALEQRIERREADEELQGAISGLKQRFNATDEQVRAVVSQAMDAGYGLESLPMIYQAMAYEASQQVSAQQTATQQAEEQRRRQAAAAASQSIGTGSSSAGTTQAQPAGSFSTIREAALAAMTELGVQ